MRVRGVWAGVVLCGLLAAGFLVATAALGARDDPPVKTQTFTDPTGDAEEDAPDITGGSVALATDGTLTFTVAIPGMTFFGPNNAVAMFLDTDRNRSTGQDGSDYVIDMTLAPNHLPVTYLYQSIPPQTSSDVEVDWTRVPSPSLTGEWDPGVGVTFQIKAQELGVGTAFDFRAETSYFTGYLHGDPGPIYYDYAPSPPDYFTFQLGAETTTSTTTTAATTTADTPVEKLTGHVGPGRSITLASRAKAGKAAITIQDLSRSDDFHLSGPGVNRKTGIGFVGKVTWNVTLRPGMYTFSSDAHAALHGTLRVS
jgi:hypothetical protein